MEDKRLSIYVSSFDGCEDLWGPFFGLMKIFWCDCKYPIYLINNEKKYSAPIENLNIIHTGVEKNWLDRTIRSVDMLSEKYILFMLEDYFISKKIKNEDIEEILNFMEDNKAYYYQLSRGCFDAKDAIRVNVGIMKKYLISLQPAIWERKKFLSILKEINGKTPWDAECYLNQKYSGVQREIYGAYCDTRDLLGYKNGVLRGKWILDTVNYYKEQGIALDLGKRKVMSRSAMLKYNIADYVSDNLPEEIKCFVKKIMKTLNIDYLK